MFCSKCGKQINDGAAFCPYCGAALSGAVSPTVESAPKGRPEIITRDVTKEMEQFTIERYQMFGWTLRGNQEVNITETHGGGEVNGHSMGIISTTKTHIKLTFERNTGMKNYSILKDQYAEYQKLEDEYYAKSLLLNEPPLRMRKFWKYFAIFFVAIFILEVLILKNGFLPMGLVILQSLGIGIGGGAIWGMIVALIIGAIGKARRKPKLLSALAELDRRMDALAKDASAYLA